jgi:hypothetical protein
MYTIQKMLSEYYWNDYAGGFPDEGSANSYASHLHRSNPNDKFRIIDSNNNVRMIYG